MARAARAASKGQSPAVAAGDAHLAVGHAQSPFVADAHVADLLLLPAGDDLHALEPDATRLVREPANDPGHRLFSVAWSPSPATRSAAGQEGRALQDAALDRSQMRLLDHVSLCSFGITVAGACAVATSAASWCIHCLCRSVRARTRNGLEPS